MIRTHIRILALGLCLCLLVLAAVSCGSVTPAETGTETERNTDTAPESETSDPGFGNETPRPGEVDYPDQNIELATWNKVNGLYQQNYVVRETDGTRTTFQTSTGYSGSFAIPTDSVMVYGDSADRFKAWQGSGAYTIDMMIAINRAGKTDYLDADPDRYKDVQTDASGSLLEHPAGGSYYMVPTKRWTP